MALVYAHYRNDNNEIFYIGIGITKYRPFSNHSRNNLWKNVVKKSGFHVEILCENINWYDACNLEIDLIKKYGRRDLGTGCLVNMTDGGEGSRGAKSDETKNKMSISQKGKSLSDKHLIAIRNAAEKIRGLPAHNKGKKLTSEQLIDHQKRLHKPVLQYTINGDFINEYSSAKKAADELNILRTSINNCCHGRSKSANGFKWVFK